MGLIQNLKYELFWPQFIRVLLTDFLSSEASLQFDLRQPLRLGDKDEETRRKMDSALKAKIASEALRGQKSVAEARSAI